MKTNTMNKVLTKKFPLSIQNGEQTIFFRSFANIIDEYKKRKTWDFKITF